MGVTITAKNSSYEFDMGYSGFFSLRKNIAFAVDREFGENYENLGTCFTISQFEENDRIRDLIIRQKNLYEKYGDVLEFLYMPDSGGEISYKTCENIYKVIKDVDFGDKNAGNDYEDFKAFLKECYSKKRNMRWY